jgi:hypothetical protein
MRAQPKVLVAAHHHHAAAVHRHTGALLLLHAVIIRTILSPQLRADIIGIPVEKGLGTGFGR